LRQSTAFLLLRLVLRADKGQLVLQRLQPPFKVSPSPRLVLHRGYWNHVLSALTQGSIEVLFFLALIVTDCVRIL
jgi:hypothetical protein